MAMLADQDDYLALTGTPSPADETLCNQITASLTAASAAAERYCGRSFASTTQTEYYDGNGYPELPLDHWPITAVASVYLDINGAYGQAAGAFPSNTLLTVGTHYVWIGAKGVLAMKFFPGFWPPYGGPGGSPWGYPNLTRHGAAANGWPRAPGCVKVTYTGGYEAIPDDVISAVVTMAAYILTAAPGGGMVTTSQSYIDTSVGSGFLSEQLARGNVPALGSARAILDSYREQRIARGIY